MPVRTASPAATPPPISTAAARRPTPCRASPAAARATAGATQARASWRASRWAASPRASAPWRARRRRPSWPHARRPPRLRPADLGQPRRRQGPKGRAPTSSAPSSLPTRALSVLGCLPDGRRRRAGAARPGALVFLRQAQAAERRLGACWLLRNGSARHATRQAS